MKRYKIRVYVASELGMFTQADHYEDYWLESALPLKDFAQGLAQYGFSTNYGKKWIMPASILTVEISE